MNQDLFINENAMVKDALKKLDRSAEKNVLVVDSNKRLLGTLSDGDIRRYLLKGESLENTIKSVYNKKPIFLREGSYSEETVKELFLKEKIELIPILDKNNLVIDYITWNNAFSGSGKINTKWEKIDVPVVIMAGGKGTRMDPFTRVLPKPLIPIGDKTIIEIIMDSFSKFGVNKYYLSINYKADMIEAYFKGLDIDYALNYIRENEFLGTAGSLKFLSDKIEKTAIVSNCDIIVNVNYSDVLAFHKKNGGIFTIISSIRHHKIPYGVIEFKEGGIVTTIKEKPEYTFSINTGVYIMEKECLDFIPDQKYFDMPNLIENLMKAERKVLTYPVNENDYVDIGEWEEYKKAVEMLKIIK